MIELTSVVSGFLFRVPGATLRLTHPVGRLSRYVTLPTVRLLHSFNLLLCLLLKKADVIIDNPNPAHGDVPYTRQLGGCGDLGEFIHLSTDYVATLNEADNVATHGQPGRCALSLHVSEFRTNRQSVR